MGTGSSAECLRFDAPASMPTHDVDRLAVFARSRRTFALRAIRLPKRSRWASTCRDKASPLANPALVAAALKVLSTRPCPLVCAPGRCRCRWTDVAVRHFGNGVLLRPLEDPWSTLDANICISNINLKPQVLPERFWHYRMSEIGLRSVVAAKLEHRGTPLGALDTKIAAHALSQQATLITSDTREFSQVPGLNIDHWVTTFSIEPGSRSITTFVAPQGFSCSSLQPV